MSPDRQTNPVTVIGAGPAGLAVAAALKREGIGATVLERADAVAPAWRGHYDRLHLHTDRAHSALPFVPMPKDYPRYASRDQVVRYLEDYATTQGIKPVFGVTVTSVRREDDRWIVDAGDRRWVSPFVVVATGANGLPHVPQWPGSETFGGERLHSHDYSNGAPFKDQDVLVVGFGNSGGEIAVDLHEHGARPALAVRGAVNVIPKELLGLPILTVNAVFGMLPPRVADFLAAPLIRSLIGDIEALGLRKARYGPRVQVAETGQVPLIDVGTIALIRAGHIAVRPGIERITNTGVVFTDGHEQAFDAIVLATGYRARLDRFIDDVDAVVDESGKPKTSGRETALPGLYLCGMYVSPRGMLYEMGFEARRIASAIAGRD
jgi:cation diffusion facilitator CzcD-associated flavoprotein CzcO